MTSKFNIIWTIFVVASVLIGCAYSTINPDKIENKITDKTTTAIDYTNKEYIYLEKYIPKDICWDIDSQGEIELVEFGIYEKNSSTMEYEKSDVAFYTSQTGLETRNFKYLINIIAANNSCVQVVTYETGLIGTSLVVDVYYKQFKNKELDFRIVSTQFPIFGITPVMNCKQQEDSVLSPYRNILVECQLRYSNSRSVISIKTSDGEAVEAVSATTKMPTTPEGILVETRNYLIYPHIELLGKTIVIQISSEDIATAEYRLYLDKKNFLFGLNFGLELSSASDTIPSPAPYQNNANKMQVLAFLDSYSGPPEDQRASYEYANLLFDEPSKQIIDLQCGYNDTLSSNTYKYRITGPAGIDVSKVINIEEIGKDNNDPCATRICLKFHVNDDFFGEWKCTWSNENGFSTTKTINLINTAETLDYPNLHNLRDAIDSSEVDKFDSNYKKYTAHLSSNEPSFIEKETDESNKLNEESPLKTLKLENENELELSKLNYVSKTPNDLYYEYYYFYPFDHLQTGEDNMVEANDKKLSKLNIKTDRKLSKLKEKIDTESSKLNSQDDKILYKLTPEHRFEGFSKEVYDFVALEILNRMYQMEKKNNKMKKLSKLISPTTNYQPGPDIKANRFCPDCHAQSVDDAIHKRIKYYLEKPSSVQIPGDNHNKLPSTDHNMFVPLKAPIVLVKGFEYTPNNTYYLQDISLSTIDILVFAQSTVPITNYQVDLSYWPQTNSSIEETQTITSSNMIVSISLNFTLNDTIYLSVRVSTTNKTSPITLVELNGSNRLQQLNHNRKLVKQLDNGFVILILTVFIVTILLTTLVITTYSKIQKRKKLQLRKNREIFMTEINDFNENSILI